MQPGMQQWVAVPWAVQMPVQQQQWGHQAYAVFVGQGALPVQPLQQGSAGGLQVGEQQQPPAAAALQVGQVEFESMSDILRDIPEY
jgi:hypothetical protein